MKCSHRKFALPLLLLAAAKASSPAFAAEDKMSKAEARQMVEDTTPRAQYNTSRKEANAAYREAVAECRSMSASERASCIKEARGNLQNDLADAKKPLGGQTSSGR